MHEGSDEPAEGGRGRARRRGYAGSGGRGRGGRRPGAAGRRRARAQTEKRLACVWMREGARVDRAGVLGLAGGAPGGLGVAAGRCGRGAPSGPGGGGRRAAARCGQAGRRVARPPWAGGVGGIVVSIAAFQAVDPGSIPGQRSAPTFWQRRWSWRAPDRVGRTWLSAAWQGVRARGPGDGGAPCVLEDRAHGRREAGVAARRRPGVGRGSSAAGQALALPVGTQPGAGCSRQRRRPGAQPDAPWWSSG